MYNSGILVDTLITDLKNEVDIAYPIPDSYYYDWLNSLEQLLYSELIQEQKTIEVEPPSSDEIITMDDLPTYEGEDKIRFEDIYIVYANTTQLIKSTLASGVIFPNTFYKSGNDLGINTLVTDPILTIVYFVRPALHAANDNSRVMLPTEFVELAKAKMRGEAYKLANEDELSAKWLNDYNVLLETFKSWLSGKAPQFGM